MTRRVRLTDPETSREAAASVNDLRTSQRIILSAVANWGPCTDEEIYDFVICFHQISVSGARTRRKELVDMGLVRDSGQRGTTKTGRKTIKWEITDEARHDGTDGQDDPAKHQRGARQRPKVASGEGGYVHPPPDRGTRQRRIRLR